MLLASFFFFFIYIYIYIYTYIVVLEVQDQPNEVESKNVMFLVKPNMTLDILYANLILTLE